MSSGGTIKGVMGLVIVFTKSNSYREGIFFKKFFHPYIDSDFEGIIMCFTRPIGGGKNLTE